MDRIDQKIEKTTRSSIKFKKIPGAKKNTLIKQIEKIKIDVPIGCFPLHTVACFVGACNSGKTNWMLRLVESLQDHGSVNRVFVMSPTFENNKAFDILNIRSDDIYQGKRVLDDGIGCILDVDHKIKKAAEEYEEYEEYCKAYRDFCNGKATYAQETMLRNNLFEEPEFIPMPRILVIMDDLSHTGIFSTSKANPFNNIVLRHRHIYGVGVSIFMAVQNFTTGVPKMLRQNTKQFFLWKTHDMTQLEQIYEQVSQGATKEDFYHAFHEATKEPHCFLTVDLNAKELSVFRKNFDEEIIMGSSPDIILTK